MICNAVVLSKGFKEFREEGSGERLIPKEGLTPVLWVLGPSTVMIVLTEFVDPHIAAMTFLAFYMRAVGKMAWITVVLVSTLLPVSLYVLAFTPLFAAALKARFAVLLPAIGHVCAIGACAVNNRMIDCDYTVGFGVLGYLFKKLDYPLRRWSWLSFWERWPRRPCDRRSSWGRAAPWSSSGSRSRCRS